MILRIGTRKSKLALWQSEWIKNQIESHHPEVTVELLKITTTGDKILDSPLSKIGGKGLFVKEIEDALLQQRIDMAVHSMKDVPAELPHGLMLCCFPAREDPRDALISRHGGGLDQLPAGAKVGTSSLRRVAQILHIRPDLKPITLRGNVDTRLRKLDSGEFDAIVLASAGLHRLGLSHRITQYFSTTTMIPAIGQGVLGLEIRAHDRNTYDILASLNHHPTEVTVRAERAFLKELEGGCQVPIAAHAYYEKGKIRLEGLVAELDGSLVIRDECSGSESDPEDIGVRLAKMVLNRGAHKVLEKVYGGLVK